MYKNVSAADRPVVKFFIPTTGGKKKKNPSKKKKKNAANRVTSNPNPNPNLARQRPPSPTQRAESSEEPQTRAAQCQWVLDNLRNKGHHRRVTITDGDRHPRLAGAIGLLREQFSGNVASLHTN